jgi:hypothetical protein
MIVNDPSTLESLTSAFVRYESALMTNDVMVLDELFWRSPFTLRFGVGENLYGFEAIARYRQLRPCGSPQRRLTHTVITTFGTDFGTANTEFQRVATAAQAAPPLGRQSQTWVRLGQGWRITAAHVSLLVPD